MSNRYKIYPHINFGISKLEPGIITFEEILKLATEFREDKNFSDVHYQLTDMRGCTFDFKQDKFSMMKSLIEAYQEKDNQKIGVYIVDIPLETAYVHLFFKSFYGKRKYCSSIEKAYELLNLSITFEEFTKKIDI